MFSFWNTEKGWYIGFQILTAPEGVSFFWFIESRRRATSTIHSLTLIRCVPFWNAGYHIMTSLGSSIGTPDLCKTLMMGNTGLQPLDLPHRNTNTPRCRNTEMNDTRWQTLVDWNFEHKWHRASITDFLTGILLGSESLESVKHLCGH